MNHMSFIPAKKCNEIANRLKSKNAEIEIYPTEHHLTPTMVLCDADCNAIANAFEAAAEKGGEYACNILQSSANVHGIHVSVLAENIY